MDALASGGGPTLISKTTFLEFQMCPKNAWLKLHKPELLEQFKRSISSFTLSSRLAARALWPHGILVATVDDEACRETEGLICPSHRGERIDIRMSPDGTTRKACGGALDPSAM